MDLSKHSQQAAQSPPYPYIRIYTLGEFVIERLLPAYAQQPRYRLIPFEVLAQRNSALTMLKILLCHAQRRSTKASLIESMWPGRHDTINVMHSLDAAASILRRHILSIPELESGSHSSLLYTRRLGGDTIFTLADQAWLWIDADELLTLAGQAIRAEAQGEEPLPYLESAHKLARGDFLEDNYNEFWSQSRRQTVDGARRRVLHHLVDIHLQAQQRRRAEELLFTYLQEYPMDEDALYRLMLLLGQQQRRQEALQIYHYVTTIMHEHHSEPAPATRELARHIQYDYSIREAGMFYHPRVRSGSKIWTRNNRTRSQQPIIYLMTAIIHIA